MKASDRQVGGDHYKVSKYQHWDVVYEMKWDYFIGNATKYLWRLGKKGDQAKSVEDVRKAIHYLEKWLEFYAPTGVTLEEACEQNEFRGYVNQDR